MVGDFSKENFQTVINDLELDLSHQTVLTEAATGFYCVTALLAAMAGAKVYAYGKSTKYGTIEEIFSEINQMSKQLGVDGIELINDVSSEIIGAADIITNSGHLRPLNADKLQHAKSGCVIPLMYESWELREEDVDISFCHNHGIVVAGTNERHPAVGVFEYLGDMALKLIHQAGIDSTGKKFVLLCNNDFGPYIAKRFVDLGLNIGVIDNLKRKKDYVSNVDWLGEFPGIEHGNQYQEASGIIFTAYPFDQIWIGDEGEIASSELKQNFPNAILLRFAGDVNTNELKNSGIQYFPEHVESGHMGILPSDVGLEPIMRLQAGGLRVGQALLEKEYKLKDELICQLIQR